MPDPIPRDPTYFELLTAYAEGTTHLGGAEATAFLLERLAISPDHLVLDLGCGSGDGTRCIAGHAGCGVVGVDRSRFETGIARGRAAEGRAGRAAFVVADAQALPFRSASFDLAIVQSVLAFLPAAERAVGECTRLLRPGGRLALNETSSGPGLPPRPVGPRLAAAGCGLRPRSPQGWRALLEGAGLTVVAARERPGRRSPPRRVLARLLATLRRLARLLVHNLARPRRWREGLLFVELFARSGFREAPYVLLVAERRPGPL